MIISSFQITPYSLPFIQPWQTASGIWTKRKGWLVQIETDDGLCGFGDCSPLPEAGTESLQTAQEEMASQLPCLQGLSPEKALDQLASHGAPATRFAIETSLLDLICKEIGEPLHNWLTADSPNNIRVNSSIGTLNDKTSQMAEISAAEGFQLLKLKVGIKPVEVELQALQILGKTLPEGVQLRLDANRAWNYRDAHYFLSRLEDLPVESVEEPLKKPTHAHLEKLQAEVKFDLALDESVTRFTTNNRLDSFPVARMIIKPAVRGGILPSLSLAREAGRLGLHTVVTSTLEAAPGIWAGAHLAAAIDHINTPVTHGLATSHWFSENLGEAPSITRGTLDLGTGPGTGFICKKA